jgi:hypothetical protein
MKPITIPRIMHRSGHVAALALSTAVLSVVTPASARAEVINVWLEGSVHNVPKGNTVSFTIERIPPGIPGTLVLRIKWHAANIVPTYAPLRVELRHGSTVVLAARNCYSIHSPSTQTPKCNYTINVTAAEAARAGEWKVVATNNSEYEVSGFALHKELFDADPTVPSFHSTYTTDCQGTVTLDMEGSTLTLTRGSTQERRISNIGPANGDVVLHMKWHADNLIPNTFHPLKIEVMNGTSVIASSNCYSWHAYGFKSPLCELKFQSGSRPASGWKLRVTNNASDDAKEFNIRKEGDPNPFVREFRSWYEAVCQ